MATDPLYQFEINRLVPIQVGGLDLSFTNSSLFMVATVAVTTGFLYWSTRGRGLVPSGAQSVSEIFYEFIAKMLRDATGQEGMRFFPLVFSLFLFVLVANLLGMYPYWFTVTSHLIVTFTLAMIVIGVVVGYGIYKHGLSWFRVFVPSGVPAAVVPFVTLIEVISFLSRPISLSIRLFANLLSGHIALKVFAGFIVSMGGVGAVGVVGAILPMFMTVALTAFEFLVAFLQAYVFAILTCMYLNDAVHTHH